MRHRATVQAFGALGVCATVGVCALYVTKSTAQSAKEGQSQAESNASPIYGATIPAGYRAKPGCNRPKILPSGIKKGKGARRMSAIGPSRHPDRVGECPLSGVKRTSAGYSRMSANEPSSDNFRAQCVRSLRSAA
jgi:hypothetical protein